MEHFDIADMFGRRQRPNLRLSYVIPTSITQPNEVSLQFVLENIGRGAAQYPFVGVAFPDGGKFGGQSSSGFRLLHHAGRHGGFTAFAGDASIVIHPGTSQVLTWGTLSVATITRQSTDIQIAHQVAAIGQPLSDRILTVPNEELLAHVPRAR